MNRKDWLNTQETAWCLMSAASYVRQNKAENSETRFSMTANGEKTELRSKIPVMNFPVSVIDCGNIRMIYDSQ